MDATTIKMLEQENRILKNQLKRVETDFQQLSIAFEQAEQLRDKNAYENERHYLYNRLFLENCPDVFCVLNKDLQYVFGADIIKNTLFSGMDAIREGISFEEACCGSMPDEWITETVKIMKEVIETQKPLQYNDRMRLLDGRHFCVDTRIVPVIGHDGACRGVVLTQHDITEVNKARENAEAAAKAKSNFLSRMSHEIRTPMNTVVGLADLLLLSSNLNATDITRVENIKKASTSLLGIFNDILLLTEDTKSYLKLEEAQYDMFSMLTDIINIINFKASEKNIDFIIDIDPIIPRGMIGDSSSLKQVLLKILTNAIKFTAEGHVIFKIDVEKIFGDKAILKFIIEDTGSGIEDKDHSSIFMPFNKFYNDIDTVGRGLGLPVVKHLVDMMDGSMHVSGEKGKGTVFELEIPQKIVDSKPLANVANAGEVKLAVCTKDKLFTHNVVSMGQKLGVKATVFEKLFKENGCMHDFSAYTHVIIDLVSSDGICLDPAVVNLPQAVIVTEPDIMLKLIPDYKIPIFFKPLWVKTLADIINAGKNRAGANAEENLKAMIFQTKDVKVLVVDDNEVNLKVAEYLLEQFGIEVDTAESGRIAVACVANNDYDLILMDYMMPEMTGVEATDAIRRLGSAYEKLPIITLSANVTTDMKGEFENSGMDDFLGKPLEIKKLSAMLRKWLPEEKIVIEELFLPEKICDKEIVISSGSSVEELKNGLKFVDEINVATGLSHALNNVGTYLAVLRTFASQLEKKIPLLKKLEEENDFKRLRIEVHGLKSSLANVGVEDIAKKAQAIENALLENDIDAALGLLPAFHKPLEILQGKMASVFNSAAFATDEEAISPHNIKQFLRDLPESIKNHEWEKIKAEMEAIGRYTSVVLKDFNEEAFALVNKKDAVALLKLVSKLENEVETAKKRQDTILIVDDDITNLKLLHGILGNIYKAVAVSSGKHALMLLDNKKPDLILLDIEMPEMDGFELLAEIKQRAELQDIPVIFLTGMQGYDREIKCLEMGAVDYIHKPVQPQLVMTRIKTHLELHAYRQRLARLVDEKTATILKLQEVTIGMLAVATEYRDGNTGDHVSRTKELVRILTENLGDDLSLEYQLEAERRVNIIKASQLHDIGKVAIPDSILLKPGQLTDEEWEEMRSHTTKGAEILDEALLELESDSMLDVAREIALYHHEKWDGSGYPNRLKGTDIPLPARIMAIADVYDALITKRPYKEAMSPQKAREIILENKGTHFDPVLIDIFDKVFSSLLVNRECK